MPFSNYSDTASLLARIEALEVALYGRLTNLPAYQLLGSGADGGVAVPIPQSNFVSVAEVQVIEAEKFFTDKVTFAGSPTRNSAEFGSFGIQGYATNNCWLGDNMFFDGAGNFRLRANGKAALLYFLGGEIYYSFGDAGNAGNAFTLNTRYQFNRDFFRILSPAQATSTTTGALQAYSAGIQSNLFVGGGRINFSGLPTSPVGLASGDLWRNGNVVNIV
ncbi:MAG TPA: hypothetical protein VK211_02680 [Kamptonema sp.]|nr:hypothetical protein [Kamptonema sp.]